MSDGGDVEDFSIEQLEMLEESMETLVELYEEWVVQDLKMANMVILERARETLALLRRIIANRRRARR